MITSLRMIDFKSFADETLHAGPFTLIVGANASGKSNIRDAFRFLHGIGRGYTLAEIVGGKYGTDWKPIRGSAGGIARFGARQSGEDFPSFALETHMRSHSGKFFASPGSAEWSSEATYRIRACAEAFSGGGLSVVEEEIGVDAETVYPDDVLEDAAMPLSRTQPALHQILRRNIDQRTYERTRRVIIALNRVRFLDLVPDRMREPGLPSQALLGDGGENLPVVLQKICEDPERKSVLIDWVRELTPMDVKDFEFSSDPSGKTYLIVCEQSGGRVLTESVSDGTLRFLAMLAALLGEGPGGLYFFEEIENGFHPSRLHLLVELIEQQTAKGRVQVIATTHSPDLLSMVGDDTFENVAVTCRLEDSNDTIIRRVVNLPNAEYLRKSQGLGRLLAGGWMEDALGFTDGGGGNDGK